MLKLLQNIKTIIKYQNYCEILKYYEMLKLL